MEGGDADPGPSGGGLEARRHALRWVNAVLIRRRAFDPTADGTLAPRDRAFARLLAATVLRRLGQIDDLIDRCIDRPPLARTAPARAVLRLGVAQLLFLGTRRHAAVDTAVRLAPPPRKGLVNAVLRRLSREGAVWCNSQDAARLNTPDWLWRSWCAAYGARRARAIAAAHLVPPPLDLTAKIDPAAVARLVGGSVLETGTVRRDGGGRIESLPGFAGGEWWVQDAAAALPARLLGAGPGDAVIDLCAAPGGKTAQLAAAGAAVTAVEADAVRLDALRANLRRLRLAAGVVRADAARWRPAAPARFVLLDAPCSSTGTIRRHPDILHLKGPGDVAAAAAAQDRLLDNAAAMLDAGGTLVYAVCSLQPAEGPDRVEALLARASGLVRDAVRAAEIGGWAALVGADGSVRSLPCHERERGGLDGFYIARLKRET